MIVVSSSPSLFLSHMMWLFLPLEYLSLTHWWCFWLQDFIITMECGLKSQQASLYFKASHVSSALCEPATSEIRRARLESPRFLGKREMHEGEQYYQRTDLCMKCGSVHLHNFAGVLIAHHWVPLDVGGFFFKRSIVVVTDLQQMVQRRL